MGRKSVQDIFWTQVATLTAYTQCYMSAAGEKEENRRYPGTKLTRLPTIIQCLCFQIPELKEFFPVLFYVCCHSETPGPSNFLPLCVYFS